MVEALIYTSIRSSLQFHGVLHGFRDRRGTGADIMEIKLAQELARIYHDPLFLVSFDFFKVYCTMDRDCIIHTL